MGTSASSKGPGGGVPMVPPWVPDPVPPNPPQDGDGGAPTDGKSPASPNQPLPQQPVQAQPSPIAPRARFSGARLNLGNFARGGDRRADYAQSRAVTTNGGQRAGIAVCEHRARGGQ